MLKKGIKNILELAEYDIYHSDYKPANFALKLGLNNLYDLMMIHIGSASFVWSVINAYTLRYLIDTGNTDIDWENPTFASKFERIQAEIRQFVKMIISLATHCFYDL